MANLTPEEILRGIIDGTLEEFIDGDVTIVHKEKLSHHSGIKRIDLPNLVTFYAGSFSYDSALEDLNVGSGRWPQTNDQSNSQIRNDTKLKGIVIKPEVGLYPGTVYDSSFQDDSALQYVDWKPRSFRYATWMNCTNIRTVILRLSSVVSMGIAPVSPTSAPFKNTPFASGGGTLYVPSDLVETYKTATNWSTLYGLGNQFLPIEGSIYETQYADGTPIE